MKKTFKDIKKFLNNKWVMLFMLCLSIFLTIIMIVAVITGYVMLDNQELEYFKIGVASISITFLLVVTSVLTFIETRRAFRFSKSNKELEKVIKGALFKGELTHDIKFEDGSIMDEGTIVYGYYVTCGPKAYIIGELSDVDDCGVYPEYWYPVKNVQVHNDII